MAGRAAQLGDQREHHRRVQADRVGRGQVLGHQHVRVAGGGHAGQRPAERGRHRPVPDVVEVGDPLGQVAAGGGEQLAVLGEGGVHGVGRGRPGPHAVGHAVGQRRVGGHQRLRVQDVRRLRAGTFPGQHSPAGQVLGHRVQRGRGHRDLRLRVRRRRPGRRQLGPNAHPADRPDHHAGADAEPGQPLIVHAHTLPPRRRRRRRHRGRTRGPAASTAAGRGVRIGTMTPRPLLLARRYVDLLRVSSAACPGSSAPYPRHPRSPHVPVDARPDLLPLAA